VDRDLEVTRTFTTGMSKSRYAKLRNDLSRQNQALIRTVDPTPFRGIGDRDLESRDASSPDSRNAKSRKRLMHKAVVTALGHISERWTDVRGQGGAEPCRTVRWRTIQKVTRQEWGPSSILHHSGPPPPPRIKDRKARGVRNRLSVVDLGALILTAREMRAQFRTPPLRLKIEWQGGSGIESRP
jgi:hypothetical protein